LQEFLYNMEEFLRALKQALQAPGEFSQTGKGGGERPMEGE